VLCAAHAWRPERLIELFGPAVACGANHRFRPRPDVRAATGILIENEGYLLPSAVRATK
jgi:hypothetical protein